MKNRWGIVLAAIGIALPGLIAAQERVQIEGKLKSFNDVQYDKVYLAITEANGNKQLDSAAIVRGSYKFDIQIKEPVLAMMFAAVDRSKMKAPMIVRNDNRMQLYLSEGKIQI